MLTKVQLTGPLWSSTASFRHECEYLNKEHQMLWHGSKAIFSSFSLEAAGRLTGATNGALGIWCAFDGDHKLAAGFAGENGALYGLKEGDGPVYEMGIKELSRLHDKTGDMEDAEAVAFYDRMRRDLISQGFERIDIVESDGKHSMCILLDPEKIVIQERDIQIIPRDRLDAVTGLDTGKIISDEAFSDYHSYNRLRILEAINRHISQMGVEDLAADGSRNFSKRVGELNQRRLPFHDALTRLTETHEEIWRQFWLTMDQDAEVEERDQEVRDEDMEPAI